MEEGNETTEKERNFEGGGSTALEHQAAMAPSTEFVKVEKNLASLGFFTPSSKRLRNAQEKSFTITTITDGKRLEMKGTIIPSAKYGLPITADQDKWIALCKILNDILQREGIVTNPISFTSAEILRLLHKHRHSGKNYKDIEEWLDVLFSTTIFSEGVVYLAKEKRRVKDRFRVFERAVSLGKELPDGKVADKNYVWFSDWQLQNINSNHLLPIDLEAYRELKNHISKALVPLLQIWLYATRDQGVFEKRYDELCQILNIQQYRYISLIKRTLGPSLDELQQFGYLAEWRVEETSDRVNYKIVFLHGEKFHRDRRARLSRKQQSNGIAEHHLEAGGQHDTLTMHTQPRRESRPHTQRPEPISVSPRAFDPQLVAEFTRRNITEAKAVQLLANLRPGQDVVAQLEIGDQLIERAGFKIVNPAGFQIRQIERNAPVPDGFETSAKRKAREEREKREGERRLAQDAQQELEDEYERYCYGEVDRYIEQNPAIFEAIKEAKSKEERERHHTSWPGSNTNMANWAAKNEMRKQVSLPTFEEFLAHKKQGRTPFLLKPVAESLLPSPSLTSRHSLSSQSKKVQWPRGDQSPLRVFHSRMLRRTADRSRSGPNRQRLRQFRTNGPQKRGKWVGKYPRKSFPPPHKLPRVQKSAKTKGYRPNLRAHPFAVYRRLPVLFAFPMKLSLHPNGSLRYRSVSVRTRWHRLRSSKRTGSRRYRPLVRQKGLRAPLTAPGKRVRVLTGELPVGVQRQFAAGKTSN